MLMTLQYKVRVVTPGFTDTNFIFGCWSFITYSAVNTITVLHGVIFIMCQYSQCAMFHMSIYMCVYSTGIFQKCLGSFNNSKTVLTTMCNLLIPNSMCDLSLTPTMYMCVLLPYILLWCVYPSLFANRHQVTLCQRTEVISWNHC